MSLTQRVLQLVERLEPNSAEMPDDFRKEIRVEDEDKAQDLVARVLGNRVTQTKDDKRNDQLIFIFDETVVAVYDREERMLKIV